MKLITKLNKANGKLWKAVCLKEISHEEWATFVATYDPYSMYHLKFKDYDMDNLGEPSAEMFNLLERLTSRQLTGSSARDYVERFAARSGDLIKLVCNKDLRCGVTATTFNRIHPGSIDQFKVQLAKEVPIDILSYPLLAQVKYDGVRIIAINDNGEVTFRTRNGKTVNLPKLQAAMETQPHTNYILDGEIVYAEGKLDGRTGISGAINSAMHGGSVDESEMVLHVFDTMPLSDWQATRCDFTYAQRYHSLAELLITWALPNICPAHTIGVKDSNDVSAYFEVLLEQGYEGLILKHENHKYTFKRSKDWVKLKEVKTADLQCTGWLEGDGKYACMIGVLTLEGEVEGKQIKVNVGSGLTDEDRSKVEMDGMACSMSYYLGELIEIKYNSVIQDSVSGLYSLFLPRFVRVRLDK